jgi:D-alanyl-D-alanine carboxypeptidase
MQLKFSRLVPAKKLSHLIWVILAIFSLAATEAAARQGFASIAVDARNGSIISSVDADGRRYPASLTKVMTLYILFEELKAKRITLASPITMSRRAAAMAPSKLGVRPGTVISVETAIRALIIKSANDVAAAVAENLAGSESNFAARMTKTARSLGMNRTIYVNASGLPSSSQVTTARDQATLALRIMRDFPQYYPYFRATGFTYNGRYTRSHNRLVGNFEGADGIKTGYTNAAGFNLTTSARRGDKRVVGVVLGATSTPRRNAYMVTMLTKAFAKARNGNVVAALAGSSKGAINPLDQAIQPQDRTLLAEAAANASTEELEGDGETESAQAPKILEASLGKSKKIPFEVKKHVAPNVEAATDDGGWNIQIGSFANKKLAQDKLKIVRKAGLADLRGKQAFTLAVQDGRKVQYRARFGGFDEASAKNTCKALSKKGAACLVLSPQS